jgi:short subunit dehydrogenase-like uncharacterized protein
LIVEEAVKREMRPVLAGRNGAKVKALADKHGLEWASFDVSEYRGKLKGFDALALAAGPFVHTSAPAVAECLESGVHYLDITGEMPVFAAVYGLDARARDAGVALVPGTGFDIVPSDCLAVYATDQFKQLFGAAPTHLEIALYSDGTLSGGTLKTMLEMLAIKGGGNQLKNGKIIPSALGSRVKQVSFGKFERTVVGVPLPDLLAAPKSTGVVNVETFAAMPPKAVERLRRLRPVIQSALGVGWLRKAAQAVVKALVHGPDEQTRHNARTYLYAKAFDTDGRSFEARLESIEAYRMTALCVVHALEALAGRRPVGALTPAQAFGPDFILSLPDTHRFPERS